MDPSHFLVEPASPPPLLQPLQWKPVSSIVDNNNKSGYIIQYGPIHAARLVLLGKIPHFRYCKLQLLPRMGTSEDGDMDGISR